MKEDLLHFVWANKRFNLSNLKTTGKQNIQILDFGTLNSDAGPDFLNAIVKIEQIYWAGHIEIHVRASDWYAHKHDLDPQYKNVILHVVWSENIQVKTFDGHRIPCLELSERVHPDTFIVYQKMLLSENWIPCAPQWKQFNQALKRDYVKHMGFELLQQRVYKLSMYRNAGKYTWEQLLFISLAESFGLKTNQLAFKALASSIPIQVISKYVGMNFQIEAFFFGQAGLLSSRFRDSYPRKLLSEYLFLKHKYGLQGIPVTYWKFSRMRPANFPTLRIAQLAGLYSIPGPKFQLFLDKPLEMIYKLFHSVQCSDYWQSHYLFDKETRYSQKLIGKARIDTILINAIVPLLYYYGKEMMKKQIIEKAKSIIHQIAPENNRMIRSWKKLGIRTDSALTTQGLIHLKREYCDNMKCLSCKLGYTLLKKT